MALLSRCIWALSMDMVFSPRARGECPICTYDCLVQIHAPTASIGSPVIVVIVIVTETLSHLSLPLLFLPLVLHPLPFHSVFFHLPNTRLA